MNAHTESERNVTWSGRIAQFDWSRVADDLNARGCAVLVGGFANDLERTARTRYENMTAQDRRALTRVIHGLAYAVRSLRERHDRLTASTQVFVATITEGDRR